MINSIMQKLISRRLYFVILAVVLLPACSAVQPVVPEDAPAPMHPVEELVKDDVQYAIDVYDPFEGMNRNIYIFNAQLDEYVLVPVVNAYTSYIPSFLRQGVHNFFSNIATVTDIMNSGLQLKGDKTLDNSLRFVSNTTIGLLGVFDVATGMGFPEQKEDFGQTLGYWGAGAGPYLVLPFFGPSNLRDTTGLITDSLVSSYFLDEVGLNYDSGWEAFYYIMQGIDTRAAIPFHYYESGSPFEYETVRLLYNEGRNVLIAD